MGKAQLQGCAHLVEQAIGPRVGHGVEQHGEGGGGHQRGQQAQRGGLAGRERVGGWGGEAEAITSDKIGFAHGTVQGPQRGGLAS